MTGHREWSQIRSDRRIRRLRSWPYVTAQTWRRVADRDGWLCQAPILDPSADRCRGPFYGQTPAAGTAEYHAILTFDHVKEAAGGPRIHDEQHGILLCHHHNVDGWASAHRDQERAYLAQLYPEVWT